MRYENQFYWQKVFKANQKNFVKSKLIDRFYIENEKLSDISNTFLSDELIKKLNNKMKTSKSFYSKHTKDKDFSMILNDKENGYVINFIAVKNFENSFVGYLVAYFKSDDVYRIFDMNNIFKNNNEFLEIFEIIKEIELGNIAHQWRQPLSVISTAATGLRFKLDYLGDIDNKELSKTLETINSQSQYLSKTIDDFRDFFKSSDNNPDRKSVV